MSPRLRWFVCEYCHGYFNAGGELCCDAQGHYPRVIAESGDEWFMLDVGNDQGRVLDLNYGRLFPRMSLVSLLAKGYWEPFKGDPEPVLEQALQLDPSMCRWRERGDTPEPKAL